MPSLAVTTRAMSVAASPIFSMAAGDMEDAAHRLGVLGGAGGEHRISRSRRR